MNFGTPQALWFFLIIPYFVFLHMRSFSDMARTRSAISLALRILLLSAIILALADMRLTRYSDKLSVFFLIDKSRSMGEASDQAITDYVQSACENLDKKNDKAGMIAFGKDAFVEAGLSDQPEIGEIKSTLQPDYSDIESAVNLAMASFPSDTGTKIVLLSDGNENIGDALTASRIAANRGTEIDSITFGKPTKGEVSAGRLILPKKIEEGESFDVRAVVESDSETDAVIEVFENDKRIGSQEVHLVPGKNVFTFPRKKSEGGFYAYRVLVTAVGDTEGENNESTDYTIVEGKPKVCFVSGDKKERPYLVNALKSEGIQADFRDVGTMPTGMVKMAPYDVIFFSDVGAENLMPETMAAYDAYVKAMGGGFAMLGCENSFGPGGYFKTPIEDMLPVTLEVTKKSYLPSVAIALVVDRSGSMGMIERGVEKIEIAKAACARSVEVLEQGDWIGVVGFDFEAQWVVPMTVIENKDEIISQIGKLRAGGGTSVYSGMYAAFKGLITADAKLKHMIIISDGVTAPGDFDKLVNEMNGYGITLTTISIGSDANLMLMQDLAKNGGGNYYFCNSIHQVPQIFTKEIFQSTNRALVEEPFQALKKQSSPVTDGIEWAASPQLLGYVATKIKPLATEALTTHRADPLLAHWQYGLGRSLAFTSDAKDRYAAAWLGWPGYKQLWTQATRWLVGGAMAGNLVPNIFLRGGEAHISVDAIDPKGDMITDASIKARIVTPDNQIKEVNLFQVAPGRYEAVIDASEIGSYLTNIYMENEDGSVVDHVSSGFSVSYPPEYRNNGPNTFLLAQLADTTGGIFDIQPDEVFRHTNQPVSHYQDLWYYLLAFAICLLPFDIAVRRLSLTGESIEFVRNRTREYVVNLINARKYDRTKPTHISELKKIKESYRLSGEREVSAMKDEEIDSRLSEILSKQKESRYDYRPSPQKDSHGKTQQAGQPEQEESSLKRLKKIKKQVWGEDDGKTDK